MLLFLFPIHLTSDILSGPSTRGIPRGYEAELATNPPIGRGLIIPYHEA